MVVILANWKQRAELAETELQELTVTHMVTVEMVRRLTNQNKIMLDAIEDLQEAYWRGEYSFEFNEKIKRLITNIRGGELN